MAMVTSKLLITDLVSGGALKKIPSNYIRPIADRPDLKPFQSSDASSSIPLIDLHRLQGSGLSDTIKQIGSACRDFGFFQITNHGIPETLIDDLLSVTREFFRLPANERQKTYSDDPAKSVRLSTSFNVNAEEVSNWRDFLRLHCYPLEDYVHQWPSNPPSFRKDVSEYCRRVRGLALKLLEAISESLGLEKGFIDKAIGKHGQHMAFNYYPPCPQPELTYGLPGHADPNLITILLQDQVPGLQVFKDAKWVTIDPIPYAFIVNIGDQMQVISNDRYKSVLHRAVVNKEEGRISVPTFYCPSPDAVMQPARELIDGDHPAAYKNFTYAEYYEKFWNRGLAAQSSLDLFRA